MNTPNEMQEFMFDLNFILIEVLPGVQSDRFWTQISLIFRSF